MSDEPQPRTILVPMDLSPIGEAKIPVVEEYARALSADVLLLHVLRPGMVEPSSVLRSEADARTFLGTVEARLSNAGINAESLLRTGAIAPTIVQEALGRAAHLIVIGTNVRPILSSAVLGSVADQVARAAPCPVLLVHPQAGAGPRDRLRCFHEDADRAGVLVQRHLGVRTIEVARIVGSVDRCNELGLDFRPPLRRRRKHDEDRMNRIRQAIGSSGVPAIDVYKLGFGYYVLDGHHRVAAALENEQIEIEADVVEYVSAADEQGRERFAARRAFELATGLTEVGAARAETYAILLDAVEQFRTEQGLEEMPRAARRWFEEMFRPLWQACRALELAAVFPGERTADLIARLAVWRAAHAPEMEWPAALQKFVEAQAPSGTVNVSSRRG